MNVMSNTFSTLSAQTAGSFYCAAVATEASCKGIYHLAYSISQIAVLGFAKCAERVLNQKPLKDKINTFATTYSENALEHYSYKRNFEFAKTDLANAAFYLIGASHPIAGIVVPLMSTISNMRSQDQGLNRLPIERYYTAYYASYIPKVILSSMMDTLSTNGMMSKEKAAFATFTIASFGVLSAVGLMPKVLPLNLSVSIG